MNMNMNKIFILILVNNCCMRIGYPCINHSIGKKTISTFRLFSYNEKRLIESIKYNLGTLLEILKYNKKTISTTLGLVQT
jgi:hypothetical protein